MKPTLNCLGPRSKPCTAKPWCSRFAPGSLALPLFSGRFMPKDFLRDARDEYDVIVIGSGLAGLTSANVLARAGHSVLLLEHHYQLGGMATWFKRKGGHIFDISLHGFPVGMIKSCRKYWTQEIADSIIQLKGIRFENPQFSLRTTFDRADFTRLLITRFGVSPEVVDRFFDAARGMNFYDDQAKTVRRENCGFSKRMPLSWTMESAISCVQYLRRLF